MDQGTENLPIDIHYNKLLDWLISRRHCQQQWQAASFIVREKINTALVDMPESAEISKLLEGTYINYFHCQRIIELLKDTECGEKNMFGQYSSQKMKSWNEIIKLYEKDCVYLAETAQMMARNVNYDIPAIKKQVAKCQQIQKDCDKKETDYANKSSELRKKYAQSCKDLGIKGEKIKSELAELVRDLPKVYDSVADSTGSLQPAMAYYKDFSNFLLQSEADLSDRLPVLKIVQSKGNVTTYEWKNDCKPDRVEETAVAIDTKDEEDINTDTEVIDWGDIAALGADTGNDETAELDFDISGITIESGGTEEGKEGIELTLEQFGEEIDWGETGDTPTVETVQEVQEGIATGEDALTILDNPQTRSLFLDDLYELDAFLNQRLVELRGEGNVIASSQFQNAPVSIQIDTKKVEAMAADVHNIISQLTAVRMQHLMLIRNSPRYVDRMKESLKQTLTLADKMVFYEKEMVVKRDEAVTEERELGPKLNVLVTKTKEMQKQMEAEISNRYKSRPVNIMGEINII